jgi:hypothetical protein
LSTETLPTWFLIIYYLYLFITLGTVIFSLILKRIILMSFVAIVIVITVPMMILLNSIGREEGLNEVEYLLSQLQQGSMWSIYAVIGYLFLIVWWLLFINSYKNLKIKGALLLK